MIELQYTSETKSFGMKGLGTALGIGASAVGIVGGLASTAAALRDDKYGVACKGPSGKAISKTVRAASGVDAIAKAKKKGLIGTGYKSFLIPQQDEQYQSYIDSLNR